eukprot:5628285-Pleurochrysis_carterae.AAC.1
MDYVAYRLPHLVSIVAVILTRKPTALPEKGWSECIFARLLKRLLLLSHHRTPCAEDCKLLVHLLARGLQRNRALATDSLG